MSLPASSRLRRWSARLTGELIRQALRTLDRSEQEQARTFDAPDLIRPNIDKTIFNVSHYGIMIPDLPEPFRFFSLMSILGTAGNAFIDTDHMLVDRPSRNATQVSGTAAPGTGHFAAYSMDKDCEIRADGSRIRLGQDIVLSGQYPQIRLQVTRPDYSLDIHLHCLGNVTWFAHTPIYKHLGLMADYQGYIEYQGQRQEIAGPCTYEYFTMVGPYGLTDRLLPAAGKIPTDFFSYQIVHIDADTQLMLAKVAACGVTCLEAAFLRVRGELTQTYAVDTTFSVTCFEPELRTAPDGRRMRLPMTFVWQVREGRTLVAEISGTVDTPFIYGLCSGYVGGYHYEGTLRGRAVSGRAYIEYVDQGNASIPH